MSLWLHQRRKAPVAAGAFSFLAARSGYSLPDWCVPHPLPIGIAKCNPCHTHSTIPTVITFTRCTRRKRLPSRLFPIIAMLRGLLRRVASIKAGMYRQAERAEADGSRCPCRTRKAAMADKLGLTPRNRMPRLVSIIGVTRSNRKPRPPSGLFHFRVSARPRSVVRVSLTPLHMAWSVLPLIWEFDGESVARLSGEVCPLQRSPTD